MEYKKIEKLVYNNNLIQRNNYKSKKEYEIKLDSMLIEVLQKCINNRVSIELNEKELTKIYKIYLKLIKNNYNISPAFIKNLIEILPRELNFYDIVQNITE